MKQIKKNFRILYFQKCSVLGLALTSPKRILTYYKEGRSGKNIITNCHLYRYFILSLDLAHWEQYYLTDYLKYYTRNRVTNIFLSSFWPQQKLYPKSIVTFRNNQLNFTVIIYNPCLQTPEPEEHPFYIQLLIQLIRSYLPCLLQPQHETTFLDHS
jgi:hypothetical protein